MPSFGARNVAQFFKQRTTCHYSRPRAMPSAHQPLLSMNIYVSEGRRQPVVDRIREAANSTPRVAMVYSFVDLEYNRSSFTLVSPSPAQLCTAAQVVARTSLSLIDLRHHAATHPRLGALDHISCHPLTHSPSQEALEAAGALAKDIGNMLACSQAQGDPPAPPVYLYGIAHPQGRRLAEIRRQLGYFRPQADGIWSGALPLTELSSYPPDLGPHNVPPSTGVATIGAVPLIVNYNIPIDVGNMLAAKAIAKEVSERGGGLPGVEAVALLHQDCLEVACNLLQPWMSPPEQVQEVVEKLAAAHGIKVLPGYRIGLSPEELASKALTQLNSS